MARATRKTDCGPRQWHGSLPASAVTVQDCDLSTRQVTLVACSVRLLRFLNVQLRTRRSEWVSESVTERLRTNLTLAAVAAEAEFLGGLSRQALFELVRSEGLAVRSERAVYEAVMGWVRHDVWSRKAWLGEMLGVVRMALLPLEYLLETVGADTLVTESVEALRMLV